MIAVRTRPLRPAAPRSPGRRHRPLLGPMSCPRTPAVGWPTRRPPPHPNPTATQQRVAVGSHPRQRLAVGSRPFSVGPLRPAVESRRRQKRRALARRLCAVGPRSALLGGGDALSSRGDLPLGRVTTARRGRGRNGTNARSPSRMASRSRRSALSRHDEARLGVIPRPAAACARVVLSRRVAAIIFASSASNTPTATARASTRSG